MTELKPCPFCGHEAKKMIGPEEWIECTVCHASTAMHTEIKYAIRDWNRRFLSEEDELAIVNGWLDGERYACDNSEDEQEACHTVLSIVMKRQEGKE